MTTLREAAQQALEALEAGPDVDPIFAGETADALRAALAEPVQEPVAWTPVTKALPQSGVKVLACYRNRLGNLRRIRAMWTAAKTEEANSDDAEACSEYDEATDTYYVTEGWYECIDNWGDYSSVAVTEGEVTHWMPLPPDPDCAPPQRPAEPVQETEMRRCPRCWEPMFPPQRKPLTEEEIEKAYREIWRGLPSDFDHTSAGWIEMGIKYAERAHGIGGEE